MDKKLYKRYATQAMSLNFKRAKIEIKVLGA